MASPNITQQVISNNEFSKILDIVESANTVLNESEAWAIGTKSGVPVLADSFSYVIDGFNFECTIDADIFRKYMGITPGYTTKYIFTCIDPYDSQQRPRGVWDLTWGNNIISNIEASAVSLADFGITLTGRPQQSNTIEVLVTDSDQQYHNNAKYWASRAFSAQESIKQLEASVEIIGENDSAIIEKQTNDDVEILEQPSGFNIDIDEDTFIDKIGFIIGDYIFYFNDTNWTLDGQNVILSEYGIDIGSSVVADGDIIKIHYNQHENFNFKLPRGKTGNVNFATFHIDPSDGYLYINKPIELNNQIRFEIVDDYLAVEILGGFNNE